MDAIKNPPLRKNNNGMLCECVMFNNVHNNDLDAVIDLTSTKETWDSLHLMHEGDTSSCIVKKEKEKSRKKFFCQAKFDIVLNEIELLKNEIKDLKKVVQICDERERE